MDCQTVRTEVHIEPATVQPHLSICPTCAAYAARFARLDTALRNEMVLHAPATVTRRVEALVPTAACRLETALRDELLVPVSSALTSRLLDLVPQPAKVTSPLDVALKAELLVQAPPALSARLQTLVPQMLAPQQAAVRARPPRWVVMTVYAVTAVLLALSLMYAGQIYATVIQQFGLQATMQEIAGLPAQFLNWLYTVLPQARVVVGAIVRLQQPLQWLLVALVLWAVIDMTQRQSQRQPQRSQQLA